MEDVINILVDIPTAARGGKVSGGIYEKVHETKHDCKDLQQMQFVLHVGGRPPPPTPMRPHIRIRVYTQDAS